jgi:hypothetical protein
VGALDLDPIAEAVGEAAAGCDPVDGRRIHIVEE